jgi:hypothetical protein
MFVSETRTSLDPESWYRILQLSQIKVADYEAEKTAQLALINDPNAAIILK